MTVDISKRIYSNNAQELKDGSEVVLAGWASDVKNMGKIAFIKLRDREGIIQLTAFPDFKQFSEIEMIPKESVVAIRGKVKESKLKSGAKEVLIEEIEVLSKSEPVLPIDFSGKIPTGLDKRLDNRTIDLRNPKKLAIFKVRSQINMAIREFLIKEKFIEIQTPKLISAGAEGGATLFPVKYYDKKAFLSQSQQLYKQAIMAAGFDKVFEIGPSFRAEKSHTTRHLTEFTHFDFEISFIKDEDDVLKILERLFVFVLENAKRECAKELELLGVNLEIPKLPFPRIGYAQGIKLMQEAGSKIQDGTDIGAEEERFLGEVVKKKYNTDAYFLTKFPFSLRSFYIMTDEDVSRGFDFEYKGEELASGGQREHRYEMLVQQMKEKGLNPNEFEFYLCNFKYGIPSHGGFGMGVDRLVKKVLDLDNIREGVLFPRDTERLTP